MSNRESDGQAAESSSPPEIVCILMVDNTFDEFEVEICCQRTNGVDRAFATDKDLDWLRDERPSESTLADSVETLLFSIIARCLYYVGEPVDVRAGLLSKKHVWAIISSVRREMEEIKKENEVWREAEIVRWCFASLCFSYDKAHSSACSPSRLCCSLSRNRSSGDIGDFDVTAKASFFAASRNLSEY